MITILSRKQDNLGASDLSRVNKELIEYCGLSTDEKPTGLIVTGSTFLEADTGDLYMFNEESAEWLLFNNIGGEGGGGGGSALPAVTSDDDGDVLTVVNGAWDKAEAGGGMVCTPIRREGLFVIYDKTLGEIVSAMRAGKAVTVIYDNAEIEYQPFGYNGVGIVATVVDNTASNETSYIYTMVRNGTSSFEFDPSLGYNAPLQFYMGD